MIIKSEFEPLTALLKSNQLLHQLNRVSTNIYENIIFENKTAIKSNFTWELVAWQQQ